MSKNNKDFSRALKRMRSNAQSMKGTSNVDFNDLFSTQFMKKYTNKTDIYMNLLKQAILTFMAKKISM